MVEASDRKPAHGGYPDAKPRPVYRPIILQIARASDDHEKWERRFAAIRCLPSFTARAPDFHDQDGKWSISELMDYMASACGWRGA